MSELFRLQWLEAVEKFTVMNLVVSDEVAYLHAEADTGSRYEFLGARIPTAWTPGHSTHFISVFSPWERVYPIVHGTYIHPTYAFEKWGAPAWREREMHGGDAAALLVGVNIINGQSVDDALAYAKERVYA